MDYANLLKNILRSHKYYVDVDDTDRNVAKK